MFSKTLTILAVGFSALSAISPASARVIGITAPATVTPGTAFPVTLQTASFSENINNYYLVFGMAPQSDSNGGLGTLIGMGYDLVENGQSETGPGSFNVSITIPNTYDPSTQGSAVNLRTVVFSTVGASEQIITPLFSTNITVA
ncbi:hypothetical protein DL93DRAFT_177235 [Clavulina sp. PMI_390]|nr:hypothetical protein DL93DRAFT_177235 [Clavulina sp. PMI_390]